MSHRYNQVIAWTVILVEEIRTIYFFLNLTSDIVAVMRLILLILLGLTYFLVSADTPADREWRRISHPIMAKHCTSCHNAADKKAGLDLDIFYYIPSVVSRGETWQKVIQLVESGEMPPRGKPRMSQEEKDSFLFIINKVLDDALSDPDPGPSVIRRLSHREYSFTIKDLLDVDFDAMAYFPKEGSGGEGFDNQSRVLFVTPLMMERYYMAADSILKSLRGDEQKWKKIVPSRYRPSILRKLINRLVGLFRETPVHWDYATKCAEDVILPFATKTFRGFLPAEDKEDLISFFNEIYFKDLWKEKDGFDQALSTVFKRILISPMFLYRSEANLPIHKPYQISDLELATRLSYLLWSSMPDDTLFQAAYRDDLHDPAILNREARRMMRNPKFKRFAQSFAPQWLGVEESLINPQADPELFPEFTEDLRQSMRREVIDYFHYVFTERRNLLELIKSDYTLLNETLASHYGVPEVKGDDFRAVQVADQGRGGILGMGAVLTSTSLANRTSPVLRGQWVLEQLLGSPAPPPPPDVPELNEESSDTDELGFRKILEKHRASPNCAGCHNKMDPIGFALENFDAIGRWRNDYNKRAPIDATAVMEDGTEINGPVDLKLAISEEKEKFAENLARKMMSYAFGRGIGFIDSPTIKEIKNSLLKNDFHSEKMMLTLVNSYPFRHRRSDMTELYLEDKKI